MIALLLLLQFSGSGSFVPGQGGLNGFYKNSPAISAVTQSPSATSVVLQWTTSIASDSRGHCGSEEAVDDGIQSGVTSHQVIVAGLAPSTGYTCTVVSGSSSATISATTTALAASTPITGVSLGTATQYNASTAHPMGGDTFYNFLSNDGLTYVATDDTYTGWSGNSVNASMMLGKFTSLSPITGADVNGLAGYGTCCTPQGPQGLSPKISGIWGQAGDLYLFLGNQNESGQPTNPQYYGSLIRSSDHGATWNNMQAPATFTSGGTPMTPYTKALFSGTTASNFASSSFVIYGADDGTLGYLVAANRHDNGDAFVYGISNGIGGANSGFANGDTFYLWRVPRAKLSRLHASDYQFYVSGDGTLDSAWGVQASAAALITNTGKLSFNNTQFIPALNRYLLTTYYYPSGTGTSSSTVWLFYESAHPWGPWTSVGTISYPSTGCYNGIALQSDVLTAGFSPTAFRMLWSCDFNTGSGGIYNLWYGTLTVSH